MPRAGSTTGTYKIELCSPDANSVVHITTTYANYLFLRKVASEIEKQANHTKQPLMFVTKVSNE